MKSRSQGLSGRVKVIYANAFLQRLEESGVKNHYLFRIRSKQKIIEAAKGVKPLSEEGRAALEIPPEVVRNRIKKNVGNYGCYAFPDGLCFLDFDLDPNNPGNLVVPFEKIYELVETFNTFVVRTRAGGYQFYFKNPGLEDNPHIYYVPPGHQEGEPLIDTGELRCKNQYVVCPGSYVPKDGPKGFTEDANGVYTVVWDFPIQTLDLAQFPSWLKTHDPVKETLQKKTKQNIPAVNIDPAAIPEHTEDSAILNTRGVSLGKIRSHDETLDDLLNGASHIQHFRSGSEADESAIFRLLKHNFSDQQVYNIMMTHRFREKLLRPDYLTVSIAHAKAKIASSYDEFVAKNCTDVPQVIVSEIPENLPSWDITLLRTFPRSGKTHRTIEWAIQSRNANYISATHETVENALNLFRKIIQTNPAGQDLLAVHIVGKERGCNEKDLYENCQHCPKFPRDKIERGDIGITFMEAKKQAHDRLREKKILTVKDVPQEMCPYYTLHLAEKIADICFTVPYYHHNNDKIKTITPRDLLIIDEDTTVRSFYPVCFELASTFKNRHRSYVQNSLSPLMVIVNELKNKIQNSSNDIKHPSIIDYAILGIIEKITQINDCINTGMEDTTPDGLNRMRERLEQIDVSNCYDSTFRLKLINKISEHLREMGKASSNVTQIFEPLIYPAGSPFPGKTTPALSWMAGHGAHSTLFAISERTLMHVPKFKKLVVIGGTEAELFVKNVSERLEIEKNNVKTITMQDFKYANNYVFFEIFDPDRTSKKTVEEPDNEEEVPSKINADTPETLTAPAYLRKLIYLYSEENRKYQQKTPSLLLTSTIKSQTSINEWLGGGSIACTDHRMDEIRTNWETGRINVFYQNSIISRGLDIPFYHTTFVYSCNFATPYWTAMKNHLLEILATPVDDGADQAAEQEKFNAIKDRIEEISRIITKIQMDETTNGILRTAPVPGFFEDHIKLVVFSEKHSALVAGACCNGVTTIPVPTTTPIEPLIGIFRRLVDPVNCKPANPSVEQRSLRPFKPVGITEAKDIISQYMNKYEAEVESFNLPIEKVGYIILTHPGLVEGKRMKEAALVKYVAIRATTITRSTIKKVIQRMVEGNLLKSSISKTKELRRMYCIRESVLATLMEGRTRPENIATLLSAL